MLYNFLQKLSIIVAIINCSKKIDTDGFTMYCKNAYLELVNNFPWVEMPLVAHAVYAHAAERIVNNDSFGLKDLAEHGLEGLHKVLRQVRRDLSRKSSLLAEIQDVGSYMWHRSDPKIRDARLRLECSNCSARNHTRRGCPLLKRNDELDEDIDIFNSLTIN